MSCYLACTTKCKTDFPCCFAYTLKTLWFVKKLKKYLV